MVVAGAHPTEKITPMRKENNNWKEDKENEEDVTQWRKMVAWVQGALFSHHSSSILKAHRNFENFKENYYLSIP